MALAAGKKAPNFTGIDQNGQTVKLSAWAGKNIVLYFYPKDNTPTCTVQACNLKDNYALLQKAGFEVVGISTDGVKSHKKFEAKFALPFTLIADEQHAIAEKYGVWGEKKFMGKVYDGIHRITFLINGAGKIVHVISKPDTKNHTQEILDIWQKLG
jgi:thioredoxin-dependent peroxiredoxin